MAGNKHEKDPLAQQRLKDQDITEEALEGNDAELVENEARVMFADAPGNSAILDL